MPVKHPAKVFRFFNASAYADAFAEGRQIYVSTLETCRQYEHPLQGDSGEATQSYYLERAATEKADSEFVRIAAQAGAHVPMGTGPGVISNVRVTRRLPDAFVLCTTLEFSHELLSETFGSFCVEISEVENFFNVLYDSINQGCALRGGAFGPVTYAERHFEGSQFPPGRIGFVKPAEPYQSQKEFRFLWLPMDAAALRPFVLHAPAAAKFCKRIA